MIVRILANMAALLVAAWLVPGIHLGTSGDTQSMLVAAALVALIFGVVNAVVKPVMRVLSLPFIILTLGLFLLLINTVLFMLTAAIAGGLSLPFTVDSWWAAFLGAIIVSIVSGLVNGVFGNDR